jgi:hypothetical protein
VVEIITWSRNRGENAIMGMYESQIEKGEERREKEKRE